MFRSFFEFSWGHRLADGSEGGLGSDAWGADIVHDSNAVTIDGLMDDGVPTNYKRACAQRVRLLRRAPPAPPPLALAATVVPATTLESFAFVLDMFDPIDEEVHCAYGSYSVAVEEGRVGACPSPYWPHVMTRFSAPGALRVAVTALRLRDGAMALLLDGETQEEDWSAVRAFGGLPYPWARVDERTGVVSPDTRSDLRLQLRWEWDDGSEYDRCVSALLAVPQCGWNAGGDILDEPDAPLTQTELLLALEHLQWV